MIHVQNSADGKLNSSQLQLAFSALVRSAAISQLPEQGTVTGSADSAMGESASHNCGAGRSSRHEGIVADAAELDGRQGRTGCATTS